MQAVIQAGGKGTRLSAITKNEIPKPMVEVAGKPLLEHQIEVLKKNGVTDIILVIGHLGHVIKDYFQDGARCGVSIKYVEEKNLLGTAGCFYFLKSQLTESDFMFVYADLLFDIDVDRMLEFHHRHESMATLFVHPNSHPFDSDLVITGDDDRVISCNPKGTPRTDWYENIVNAGLFIFNKKICDYVEQNENLALEKGLLNRVLSEGEPVYAYRSSEYVKDVGTVERLQGGWQDMERGFIAKRNLHEPQKCIFLDRDGTLNILNGLIDCEEKFHLEQGAIEAVKMLNASGWLAIVVTNQPVVARGMCSMDKVQSINRKMQTQLGEKGAYVDDIIFCPHHPDKGYPEENPAYKIVCDCRKPKTGMIDVMVQKYNIDLSKSWLVGDSTVDIQTAKNAGLKSCLVSTGEAGKDGKYIVEADLYAKNVCEGIEKILKGEQYVSE